MGNFEANIPKSIEELQKQILAAKTRVRAIEAMYLHDCNCEYCDEVNEDLPDDAQEEVDELNMDIVHTVAMINRLKRHAKLHNIALPAK